jgi:hypothetical protein
MAARWSPEAAAWVASQGAGWVVDAREWNGDAPEIALHQIGLAG